MATRTRLSVILHADVVGSTALVQRDERVAHERIHAAFARAAEVVASYGGTTLELRGDALVAEFQRASDAATAALGIQAASSASNEELTDEIRPVLRIGIALGEVVVADNTVTGPGVVLAQRLEQLAPPGGVCLQGSVHESVPPRFPFDYLSLGDQLLKGFGTPVRAVSVTLRAGERLPEPEGADSGGARPERPALRWIAAAVVVLVVAAGGLLAWWQPWTGSGVRSPVGTDLTRSPVPADQSADDAGKPEASGPALPERPSIAVLAFDNLSPDPEQDYFAEGIAEDIITDLSKRGIFVVARNSSFSYKGKQLPIRTIARQLGVRYVLEGSVRRAGDTLRVNTQLIDAETELHVWAERYDGALDRIFDFQDQITRGVVGQIAGELSLGESGGQVSRMTSSVEAYDKYVQARWIDERSRLTGARISRAHDLLREAVRLDPQFAEAYGLLASRIIGMAQRGGDWGTTYLVLRLVKDGTVDADVAELGPSRRIDGAVQELVSRSLSLQDNAVGRRARAQYYRIRAKDLDAAAKEYGELLRSEPGDADGRIGYAGVLRFLGRTDEADRLVREAMRLNPNYPPSYQAERGKIAFARGDYAAARITLRPVVEARPSDYSSRWYLAAALAFEGEVAEANLVLRGETTRPSTIGGLSHNNSSNVRREEIYRDAGTTDRLLEGLKLAGMKPAFEKISQ